MYFALIFKNALDWTASEIKENMEKISFHQKLF